MKISINYWTLGGFEGAVPIAEAARQARAAGFDAIEPCFGAGELTPETTDAELARIRADVDATGLELASLATGYYWSASLGSPDEGERTAAIDFTRAYVRAASRLGATAVLVMPGTVDVGWDASRPVAHAALVYELAQKSIRSLMTRAESEGVVLALENVWGKFLTGPFEFRDFIDTFESPWVKSYCDVGNAVVNGYPEHWIDLLGSRIARIHVKNFRRRDAGGTLSDFTGSLLEGDVAWESVFEALARANYEGHLTAEMLVSETGLPDRELANRTAAELRSLVDQYTTAPGQERNAS